MSKFDLIMTVNITCMMVLASVYLYVSGSLPSTSDIKPVEVWLIFNLIYPCFIILSNVLLQVRIFIIDTCSLLNLSLEVLEKPPIKRKVSDSTTKVFLPEKQTERTKGFSIARSFAYYYNPMFYIIFSVLYFSYYYLTII